jgi:SH3-like domain-containing protein
LRRVVTVCLALLAGHLGFFTASHGTALAKPQALSTQQASLSPAPPAAGMPARVPPPIVATGLPVPRWVAIKAARVNVRRGPSLEEEILWTYVKPGMPIEIIAEYDSWRRIRDMDGSVGWVKAAMLDGRRSVLVTGVVNAPLLRAPRMGSQTLAYAAPGLIARLVSCAGAWCEISSRGYDGYVERSRLWGVYAHERVN